MEVEESGSENESASRPSNTCKGKAKANTTTKYLGSFKYKSRYKKEWTVEWPFIRLAPGKESFFT